MAFRRSSVRSRLAPLVHKKGLGQSPRLFVFQASDFALSAQIRSRPRRTNTATTAMPMQVSASVTPEAAATSGVSV